VTGLGIAGLAIALGTQALVKDAISGIFLLAEDQYRRGDFIRIADVSGTVEDLTLRRTIIRDQDGVVHSVPNGSITVVSNYTRDFALVNVPVRVAYGEDLARVESVAAGVGREIANSPRFKGSVVDMPRVTAVESVEGGAVILTVATRTQPAVRWDVAAELRRRLADAFVSAGIKVPFPSVGPEDDSGTSSKGKGQQHGKGSDGHDADSRRAENV
jgi:small conductance mechanosensitive channel